MSQTKATTPNVLDSEGQAYKDQAEIASLISDMAKAKDEAIKSQDKETSLTILDHPKPIIDEAIREWMSQYPYDKITVSYDNCQAQDMEIEWSQIQLQLF